MLLLCASLVVSRQALGQNWKQKGQSIYGLTPNIKLGEGASINATGDVVAVGSPFAHGNVGLVRVYYWDDGKWEQKGQDLIGDQGQLGMNVTLDSAGNRLSAGRGKITSFQWNGVSWVKMGKDIAIEGNGGADEIEFSSDGNRLVVGVKETNTDGMHRGYVAVYDWDGTDWEIAGEPIYGKKGEWHGSSASISSDGSTMAVGASYGLVGNGTNGYVQVYHWDGEKWNQRGKDILGLTEGGRWSRVSLNSDGSLIAIGATFGNRVRVLKWTGENWEQLGTPILGSSGSFFGSNIDLSDEGSVLAVGAFFEEVDGKSVGAVHVYRWNGVIWTQIANTIVGEHVDDLAGVELEVAHDGRTVVVSSTGSNERSGQIRVFHRCPYYSTDNVVACDSLRWIDGSTYFTSNRTALDTLISKEGCDSIVRLDLKLKHSVEVEDAHTACDEFQWIDGKTYTESNNSETLYLTRANGCDSVVRLNLVINESPSLQLTQDTSVCYGDSAELTVETSSTHLYWNTGDTSKSIRASKGRFIATASFMDCETSDSVFVSEFPPLKLALEDAYYICPHNQELVRLDAGNGFDTYLWYPTNDTTRWIIVGQLGDYFVVVDDFRGCSGDKGTRVEQRCDLTYFFPNAFSPNNDGLNDFFRPVSSDIESLRLKVYSRWGELIYEGSDLKGWDGSGASKGMYLFQAELHGYNNGNQIIYQDSGTFFLVR
ncbi:MAG: gliding motility-associated C-terminal domain-containing protein [Bacteroidia bacterium]|nr:gliding motility-associated C-terminal domain-containing protein [Bacteroidia bacterium]